MRAHVIDAYGQIPELRSVPDPGLVPPRHVLIRVEAVALNPADSKVLAGGFTSRILHASRFPLVIGFDFSGIVESAGDGVQDIRVGNPVFGHLPYSRANAQGALADFVVVPIDQIAPVPDGVDHVTAAATATAGSTALQGIRDTGRIDGGGRVLINGASGGVGSFAVQIAKLLGAEVTGTCSASKADYARELGCDHVVDYRQTAITDLSGPFDIVFDVAATSGYRACAGIMAPDGAYVTTLPSPGFFASKLVLAPFSKRSATFVAVESRRVDLATLAGWLSDGVLKAPIDSVHPFDALPAALERLNSGQVQGKVVVEVG